MSGDKLTALQWKILEALATIEPAFTLTGGAALAGVHLGHRTTRDLDLFWRQRDQLGDLVEKVRARLPSTVSLSLRFKRVRPSIGSKSKMGKRAV